MDALLENDERCLQTMAAIQRLNSNTKNIFCTNPLDVSTALAPDILALSLLRKIHFDPLVLIDWVSSEPELSFVFLKQFSHRLANYNYMNCSNFVPATSKCQTPKVPS
uniref:Uncharacterized protein n=1 Tax=Globodera rostochiensis TaxID=31243 RepID=A0A914HDL5_GLORO